MRKVLLKISLINLIIMLPIFMYVSALFSQTVTTTVGTMSFLGGQSSDYVYNVSSEADLRKIALDQDYNTTNKTSTQTARRIITLTDNITLTANLLMTSDFNINLNNKNIDLNGYVMTIRTNYYGEIAIYGGTITTSVSGGKLVLDTPNATHAISTSVISTSLVEYLSFDADALKTRVFSFIDDELMYGDSGNYYYTDINLPTHYYTYDIDFSYTSSDPSVFSNNGKLLNTTATAVVNFSLQLTINGQTFIKTTPITVNAVPLSNKTKWLQIATELFDNNIAKYLGESSSYYITNNTILPTGITYPGITYSYSTTNPANLTNGTIITLTTNTGTIAVNVTATIGGQSGSPFSRTFNIVTSDDNYHLVSDAMSVMFPDGSLTFTSLTSTYTIPTVSDFSGTIAFTMMNSNTNYLINNGVISINTQNPPTMLTQAYVEVHFTFNGDDSTLIKRRVKLNYNPSGNGGSTDYFADFYYYLNALLGQRTNNYKTYTAFQMPKSYGSAPKFKYRLVTTYESDGSAYSGSTIASVTDNTTTWQLNINTTNVPMRDIRITVYYQYTFDSASETYTEYASTSHFIIPGIVHSGEDIADSNLYTLIKAAYCPDESVLLYSVLSNSKALFEVHNSAISNFQGIEYLTNTTAFDFSGSAFSTNSFTYLSGLNALTSLNLSNTGLTTISSFPTLLNLQTLNVSNNKINMFRYLDKLTGLTTLYIYGQTNVSKPSNDTNSSSTAANYGNNGIYNTYTLIKLSIRGCSIYKTDASTLFVPTADQKTAQAALSGIIYQSTAPTTTSSTQYIPSSVSKASSPTATYTLTKLVLSEASSSNTTGMFVLSTAVNGTTVYRLLDVKYGTLQ